MPLFSGLSELGPEVIKAFVLPQVKPLGARLEQLAEQPSISPADKLATTHLKQLFAVSRAESWPEHLPSECGILSKTARWLIMIQVLGHRSLTLKLGAKDACFVRHE